MSINGESRCRVRAVRYRPRRDRDSKGKSSQLVLSVSGIGATQPRSLHRESKGGKEAEELARRKARCSRRRRRCVCACACRREGRERYSPAWTVTRVPTAKYSIPSSTKAAGLSIPVALLPTYVVARDRVHRARQCDYQRRGGARRCPTTSCRSWTRGAKGGTYAAPGRAWMMPAVGRRPRRPRRSVVLVRRTSVGAAAGISRGGHLGHTVTVGYGPSAARAHALSPFAHNRARLTRAARHAAVAATAAAAVAPPSPLPLLLLRLPPLPPPLPLPPLPLPLPMTMVQLPRPTTDV